MTDLTRRDLLRTAPLLALGVALRAEAGPTEPSGGLGTYGDYAKQKPSTPAAKNGEWKPTEDNILGPFHREGAPYRAKITPPLEPGTVLLVRGRVLGHDTRKPLAGATLDIWQANATGRYDNDDSSKPPAAGVFMNRARVFTNESGEYEFETIHPGRYKIAPKIWRPSHIHYWVRANGYQEIITQLYFKGDPENAKDSFIKPSLIIELEKKGSGTRSYEVGTFDVVLAKS